MNSNEMPGRSAEFGRIRPPAAKPGSCIPLLGIAVLVAGCQTPHHQQKKEEAYRRWSEVRGRFKHQLALQQYNGGLFDEAVMTSTEAISLDPNDQDAYVVLARANLELDKTATAQAALDAAADMGFESAALAYTGAVIREQQGDLPAALEGYRNARMRDDTKVQYLLAEAECLVALDRLEESLALLDEHGGVYDDQASVATLSAHIARRLGDQIGAIERYRRAYTSNQESRTVARELGLLLARQQRCDEAITKLTPLLDAPDTSNDESLVRRTLASCYLQLGAPEAAQEVISAYATRNQGDPHAQLLLAKSALAMDDIWTALPAVERAERLQPNHPEVWLVRATLDWRRGDLTAAANVLYDYLVNRPQDADAMCLLAEVLQGLQKLEGAQGYFERALAVNPQSVWAKAGLASLLRARSAPEHDASATSSVSQPGKHFFK